MYYLQSRYYDPAIGRFINADGLVSTGQGILGNNMYAYCNNNPIIRSDATGEFSWVIIGVLAVCTIVGGILGYNYDGELGAQASQNNDLGYTKPKHPSQTNNTLHNEDNEANTRSQETNKKVSTKTKVKNTLVGAGLGLSVGGGLVALGGAIGTLAVGSGSTYIGLFGATGLQTTALGAFCYNLFGMIGAPFFGVEIEPIELTP